MKSRTFVRSCLAALTLSVATACGDSGGPAFESELNNDVAMNAAQQVYYNVQDGFAGMNFGSPELYYGAPAALTRLAASRGHVLRGGALPQFDLSSPATIRAGVQAVSGAGCTTSATGTDGDVFDPIDANDNNVPDDWSVKITCVSHDSAGEDETRVETTHFSIRVKEHTNELFGFDASVTSDDHEDYTNGNDEKQGYEQSHIVSVTATGATSKYRARWWEDYFDEGVRDKWEGTYAMDLAFDPDGTITAGVDPAFPDGLLTAHGSVEVLDEDGNFRFELSTPEPLEYSAECDATVEEQKFVAGQLVGLLNGDEEVGFVLSWGPCGTGTHIGIIGEIVEPPAPGPRGLGSR
jgi:hypothetical protein